jgi:ankyrin repeat protein
MSHSDPLDVESEPWKVTFEREQLHFAAQDGNVAEVKRLLAAGYQPNVFDELGKTPLHYAAARGHLDVMRVLLTSGADVNANDETVIGNTPLREVAGSCSFEVAKILIDAGADPTIPGWMQITALHEAQARTRAEGLRIRELLEQAASRFTKAGT